MVGLWEARLIYFVPSVQEFLVVDAMWVIWFLAPLIDMLLFGFIGVLLGLLAGIGKSPGPRRVLVLAATLIGCVGADIGWASHFIHTHSVNFNVYSRLEDVLFPVTRFAIVFVIAMVLGWLGRRQFRFFWDVESPWPTRKLAMVFSSLLLVSVAGVTFYTQYLHVNGAQVHASETQSSHRPNIVVITMDTVRADHLSAYGYDRDTSPDLARLAAGGVLFENAISASSWTLPSLSAIYTGLLPHQSGADTFRPLDPGWNTIESVLGHYGYATAGFNANYYYGESGWGLGNGFESYNDDRTTLLYNLSRTLVGRAAVQPLYQNLDRDDAFYRRDAGELNDAVFQWLRNRPDRPFYLYINYFDAHSPYLPPAPYDHHFGTLPEAVVRRWSVKGGFRPKHPLPSAAREALIDGYDNSLFYLDSQVGRLVHFLETSAAGRNTIFIITADHGEAFGEHGAYQHGNDLHREEIHVPLIVYGKGIPAGVRITPPVPVRSVFATAIDLALGNQVPMHQYSLARFWQTDSPQKIAHPVVSELSSSISQAGVGEISLTTAHWHYILTTAGKQYLYNWATDPGEKTNLSSLPPDKQVVENLNSQLRQLEGQSAEPWIGTEYLFALGEDGLAGNAAMEQPKMPPEVIGAAQSYFRPIITLGGSSPTEPQSELLKTLPYQ